MALSKTARTMVAATMGCLALGACADDEDDTQPPRADAGLDAGGGDGGIDAGDAATDAGLGDAGVDGGADAGTSPLTSFFVTSDRSTTGNLGGLAGADARCQRLAAAVGLGAKTWRAFLSAENAGNPIHARERIGDGPWFNARGVLLAQDLDALFARTGDAAVFLDERGARINGQWEGSPTPNEHDILTGSDPAGRVVPGQTCADWTSSAPAPAVAKVGHSDGLGPMRNGAAPFSSWQSSHESAGCDNTAPRGGAGKIYCFAAD